MASFLNKLLPVVASGWKIYADLGGATYTVKVRTRTWSGGKVKLGTESDSDLTLENVQVREVNGDRELEVYAITPSHVGGGYTPAQLNPSLSAGVESYYVVTGPNGTHSYTLTAIDTSEWFEYKIRLSALNRAVPF